MAKHIHIYFPPKRTRDQAPGSVPPSKFMPLVQALHQIIAERQAAQDADFDESKVKRDEGGKFSAQQHSAKAAEHEAAAAKSEKGTPAHQAHTEAAQAHMLAAQHITTGTGWASHHSEKAMQASQKASAAAGPANLEQLKATASNPKASVEERAAAVQHLDKMEKAANAVAASPHAIPKPAGKKDLAGKSVFAPPSTLQRALNKANAGKPLNPAEQALVDANGKALAERQRARGASKLGPDGKPMGTHPDLQKASNAAAASKSPDTSAYHPESDVPPPQASAAPLGPKPTTPTSKGIKNQTHELLSSGHPFSLEELMKATGVQKPDMMRAYLADLKNPKYAAKAGALTIVKRLDGQYHVEKQPDTPVKPKSVWELAEEAQAKNPPPGLRAQKVKKGLAVGALRPGDHQLFKAPLSGPSSERDPGEKFAGAMAANKGGSGDTTKHSKPYSEYANDMTAQATRTGTELDHLVAADAHEQAGNKADKAGDDVTAAKHFKAQGFHEREATKQRPTPQPFGSGSSQHRTESEQRPGFNPLADEEAAKTKAAENTPDHTALHEVLKGAAGNWPGSAMNPAHVEAAAKYMAGKRGVDLLKLSDAAGLSIGAAQHLNKARLEHFKTQGGGAKLDRAEMANNYFKQKFIKMPQR